MARREFKWLVLQKEWLDKCEQAKRTKLTEDDRNEAADGNGKRSKEEKAAAPSRSMSLDSNTLGTLDSHDEAELNFSVHSPRRCRRRRRRRGVSRTATGMDAGSSGGSRLLHSATSLRGSPRSFGESESLFERRGTEDAASAGNPIESKRQREIVGRRFNEGTGIERGSEIVARRRFEKRATRGKIIDTIEQKRSSLSAVSATVRCRVEGTFETSEERRSQRSVRQATRRDRFQQHRRDDERVLKNFSTVDELHIR